MPWFNVDDGFAFHRKAVKAGNAAIGLWTRAGSWSNQQLTDGLIPDEMVAVLGTDAQARRLVTAGLWTRTEGGYQFHEWNAEGRNKTRAQVEAKRTAEAEKKAGWRAAKAAREADPENSGKKNARTVGRPQKNSDIDPPVQNDPFSEEPQVNQGCPQGTDTDVPWGVPEGHASTTPLPSQKNNQQTSSVGPRKRATRIPDNFATTVITPELVQWAHDNTPQVDGRYETLQFVDYWTAKSGKDATKVDWIATWRRWMRKAQQDITDRRAPTTGQPLPNGRPATGSKRMDKALAALHPDDPFLKEFGRTTNQLNTPEFLIIEGGRTA